MLHPVGSNVFTYDGTSITYGTDLLEVRGHLD